MTEIVPDWGETPDELANRIYHLRKIGVSYPQIRVMLKHDGVEMTIAQLTGLYRDYMVSIAQAWGPEERDHIRMLEMERLDELQASHWTTATSGGPDSFKATEVVLKIMAQRQKITGMDIAIAADKTTVNTLLIVGEDQSSFIEALTNGKTSAPVAAGVTGRPREDDEDEEEGK